MTPADVAQYMASRLLGSAGLTVLDPCAGLGILSHAALLDTPGLPTSSLYLVELDEALAARLTIDPEFSGATVSNTDFFDFAIAACTSGKKWSRVIANPPYLNFHDFDRGLVDRLGATLGIEMSRLSNLFALFILAAARLLEPHGRMVFITPTELFSTNYGRQTLQQLPPDVRLSEVTVFEPLAEPFATADTTACVSVFDRSSTSEHVIVRRVTARCEGAWTFAEPLQLGISEIIDNPKRVISESARSFNTHGTRPLGDLVRVSRGIATGSNEFFVVDDAAKNELDPDGKFFVPVIAKAEDLGSALTFAPHDFEDLAQRGRRCWLMYLRGDEALPEPLRARIAEGRAAGIDSRYLCAARKPWYAMEQQTPPVAFVRVFGRDGVKVLMNDAGVRSLACCHRIHHHTPVRITDPGVFLLACYLRSSMGAHALAAQSRRYGGGLMKLEPKDVERVAIPDIASLTAEEQARLAGDARAMLKHSESVASFDAIVAEVQAAIQQSPPRSSRLTRITEFA